MTSDSEGDVYCDTLEQMEPEQVTEGWEALESCRTTAEALPAASPALPALYRQISLYSQLPQLCKPPQHCHPGSPVRLPEPMGPPGCTPLCFVSLLEPGPHHRGGAEEPVVQPVPPVAPFVPAVRLQWGTGGLPGLSKASSPKRGWYRCLPCTPATRSLLPATGQLVYRQQRLAFEVLWRGLVDPVGRREEAAWLPGFFLELFCHLEPGHLASL